MSDLIYIKKYGSIDNSLVCFLSNTTNNNIESLKLNFAEVYNNGFNTNNFNVYDNEVTSFDNSIALSKFTYLNNNVSFLNILQEITLCYKNLILGYRYSSTSKVITNKLILEDTLKECNKLHYTKKRIVCNLIDQLEKILLEG